MHRLLIASGDEAFSSALTQSFYGDFDIRSCGDGEAALELLLSFTPDVLVLDLMLPYKDGLTVLQESAHKPPVILAITPYLSAYVQQTAERLGIGYLLCMPTVSTVRVRVMDMLGRLSSEKADVPALLHMLGFTPHLDGYHHLCAAIPLFCKDPGQALTKELYPAVGLACGCKDARSVEHSIRMAIRGAWQHKDAAVWQKYFPRNAGGKIPCPTNKAFISRLALEISPEKGGAAGM